MTGSLWIGLMSGTSADGVDAALVRVGETASSVELISFRTEPLDGVLRERVHGLLDSPSLREWMRLHRELGERFADASLNLLREAGVDAREVAGIGSHGQTVGHFPEAEVAGSLQLGSPAVIHERTGIPVVADFRSADLAAGGQGAPLTPFFHHAYFSREGEARAVLNIGGFTNVTYLPGTDAEKIVAFDPGPGNALLDRASRWASEDHEGFDRGGKRASRGRVFPALLEVLLEDPYFAKPPPKSTGHEHFGRAFFERTREAVIEAGGGADDLLATLAALSVESVGRAAAQFFPTPADRWIVYGGGVHNPVLMEGLRARVAPAPVEIADGHGLPGDAVEAVSFALLGWTSSLGLPGNVPRATGARRRVVLGSSTPPAAFGSSD
jgi:anhydro-N-acetylmuramic acid kinase